jgi:sialic acid synthase SpsE
MRSGAAWPSSAGELVRGVRTLDRALASPVDKDAMADRLEATRALFMRSVVARRDLAAGAVLAEEDLAVKKPGGGLPPQRLAELVGRRLEAAVAADEPLSERHVGQPRQ